MTHFLLAFALMYQPADLEKQLVDGHYLTVARALQKDADTLASPEAVRRYTVLLTEYYAHQVAFRGFFMKNIEAGERLRLVRAERTFVSSPNYAAVEDDLEGLLLRAEKAFPNDPDIRFAQAVYVFNGSCCFIKPKLRMTQAQVLGAFREAEKRGIVCGSSLWALALDEMARDKPNRERLSQLLKKTQTLRPDDLSVYLAFVDDLLQHRQYEAARAHLRSLFETAVTPNEKADTLVRSARTFSALQQDERTLEVVQAGLKLSPRHGFLLMLGLDTLRRTKDQQAYNTLLGDWLAQDPEKPALFQVYLDFMRQKDTYPLDEAFIEVYAQQKDTTPLGGLTRTVNLLHWALFMNQPTKAETWLAEAQQRMGDLEGDTQPLKKYLSELADRVAALKALNPKE